MSASGWPQWLRRSVQIGQRAFATTDRHRFDRDRQTIGERIGTAPVLILITTGRKSGLQRRTPLVYLDRGTDLLISGGAGGVPWDPDWVLNLRATPLAHVLRVSDPPVSVEATELVGEQKQAVWDDICRATPRAARYARRRLRPVPVFRLTPIS